MDACVDTQLDALEQKIEEAERISSLAKLSRP
jgi:hypothetical protein